MARSRRTAPAVAAFPDRDLAGLDAIARAEAALAELATEFAGWMRAECDRLDAARATIKAKGLIGTPREDLFRIAHDIKGEAATFGYPQATEAAESLCRLLEHAPDACRVPLALIEQHVDGIRAIIFEHAREPGAAIGSALAAGLRQLTEEFLLSENRGRPDYLDGIVAVAPAAHAGDEAPAL